MTSMVILDQRTLDVKYRIPIGDILRISLSPHSDDMVFIHVSSSDKTKGSSTFLFESGHVIELVTKVFLVVQSREGRVLEIEFCEE
jgi:myosin-1